MLRCLYGIASSAFHCTRAVKEVADLCANKDLGHSIKVDFYVDDYLSGANSITEAKLKVAKVCKELEKFGMQLRKWTSSHHEITTELPEKLRQNIETSKIMHEDYRIKTLGISWKSNTNNFFLHGLYRTAQFNEARAAFSNSEALTLLVGLDQS